MSKILWRACAIVIFLTWVVVFISANFLTELGSSYNKPIHIGNLLYSASILISILLIFNPTNFRLYTLMCYLWGLESIIDGDTTNGILMCVLGYSFAQKDIIVKGSTVLRLIYTMLPALALLSQFRLGIEVFIESFLDVLFLVVFFTLLYFLYIGNFKALTQNKLDLTVLKQSELAVLKEVLANKTYSTIGNERNKSESSIKLVMQDVYAKLKLKGKKELMDLYERKMIELPE